MDDLMSGRFDERFRCHARNRAGGRCGRSAIPGGHVCRQHGGAAPQVRAKAAERLQVQEAWRAVARLTAERERVLAERPPRRSWGDVVADELERGIAAK